jgi:hypothetical protein
VGYLLAIMICAQEDTAKQAVRCIYTYMVGIIPILGSEAKFVGTVRTADTQTTRWT